MSTRSILVTTDGTALSKKAIKMAVASAKAYRAKLIALHVTPPFHTFTFRPQLALTYRVALRDDSKAGYDAAVADAAEKILASVRHAAEKAGVDCATVHVAADEPYRAILYTAKKKGCDLIAMASHGRAGVAAALLGSETQKVLAHSTLPVLVCR